MKTLLSFVIIALVAAAGPAGAGPIPGSSNELTNGDFEAGAADQPPPGWEVAFDAGQNRWEVLTANTGNPGKSANCFKSLPAGTWGDRLRQVVDESKNPLWLDAGTGKIIDLQADIKGFVSPFALPGVKYGVRFRLDLWGPAYNGISDPSLLPPPTSYTGWVEYLNPDTTKFTTVNPFNRLQLDYQPRWVSVEIEYMQPDQTFCMVDNVNLTARCTPEPATVLLSGMGLAGLAGLRRGRRA